MENLEVELKLTVAHINTILTHLAKGAYHEVADLIAHLRNQAVPQVAAATPAVPQVTAATTAAPDDTPQSENSGN